MRAISLYLPPEAGLKKEREKRCVPFFCNSVTIFCILPPKSGEKMHAISLYLPLESGFLNKKKREKKMRASFLQQCNNCLYLTSEIR